MAAKKRKPNWIAIRAEYEAGGISQRALAEKCNVPYPTLRDRAKRESWAEAKEETRSKIIAETSQKIVDTLSTEAAQATINHRRLWGLILQDAEERLGLNDPIISPLTGQPMMDDAGKPYLARHVKDAKHLDALTNAVKKAVEGDRAALGLDKRQSDPADDKDFNGSLWEGLEDDEGGAAS